MRSVTGTSFETRAERFIGGGVLWSVFPSPEFSNAPCRSLNESVGEECYGKDNSLKRSGPFGESLDSDPPPVT